jgi:hypothetical protein
MNEATREELYKLAKNKVFRHLIEEETNLTGISIKDMKIVAIIVGVNANAEYKSNGQTEEENREFWVRVQIHKGIWEPADIKEL